MKKIFYTEDQITEVAEELIQEVPSKTLCFHGKMGCRQNNLDQGHCKTTRSGGRSQ